jgi:Type VI secretion system/phage-baseplate injector OB domain
MSMDTPAPRRPYYGKYKGVVVNNVDPLFIGRLQVICPDVASLVPTTWAMPCVPVAGINMGMFAPPIIGSGVWIEFERGDCSKPIWVGCYWGLGAEVPLLSHIVPPAVPGITLQTTLKNGIVISDTPGPTGGILIQSTTGAMISVSDVAVVITNGKGAGISMIGPALSIIGQPVDVNIGALTVM